MSSFPKELIHLDSYNISQPNERGPNMADYYTTEIHYLEQELDYWTAENARGPCKTKEKKIKALIAELKHVKEAYLNSTKNNA
jgi:hypothetical protein